MTAVEIDAGRIAKLARLELSDDEVKLYGRQLGAILEYIGQLGELDTASVPPTAHVLGLENAAREDVAVADENREAIIANFPVREHNLLKVKKIIE